ncbi:hypothetical protein TWF730_008463 [Orbilia blumenaviensis]|uniref:Uncharacterized protein n=1 Tax=Orbilia blumenaviensis TaxID=1796055 RepID=A0AAV9V694_9PEZI
MEGGIVTTQKVSLSLALLSALSSPATLVVSTDSASTPSLTYQSSSRYVRSLETSGDAESQVPTDLGTRLLAVQSRIEDHEAEVTRLLKAASPILGWVGRVFVEVGSERHKLAAYDRPMDQRAQEELVTKICRLKRDGDRCFQRLGEVARSFDAAQKSHNLLRGEVCELERAQDAARRASRFHPTSPAESAPIRATNLQHRLRWIEIDLVKLWERQIHDIAIARGTLSNEYEKLVDVLSQHVHQFLRKEEGPNGMEGAEWAAVLANLAYGNEDYPLMGVRLELRTSL